MLIDCPACARSYHVNPVDIEGGRTLACPACDATWFAAEARPPRIDAAERVVEPRVPFAPRPADRRRLPRPSRAATIGLASLALLSLTLGARARIVEMVPRTAALYAAAGLPVNLRGLTLAEVRSVRVEPSSPEVTISGEIRNVAGHRLRLPRLAFEVRDDTGRLVARWSEHAPAKLIASGRSLAFASAPHVVPPDSRSVLVHFQSDGDPG